MIPKYLKIKNFLSHDESEIDFEKFDAALILGTYDNGPEQSNGAGKSAIFEAITWALFGRSRHKKKDGVVKWNCRACRVEFTFWVDDALYRITRTRDKIVGESDVTLEKWNGSAFYGISCDTNTATDIKITSIVNVNYEVFVNSIYFKQDDISMFATSTASKRKDVIKALLKMSKWDAYQKKTKDRLKSLSAKIDEKSQQLVPMIKLETELEECSKSIKSLKKSIRFSNKEYEETSNKLTESRLQYQSLYNNTDDNDVVVLDNLQKEFADAQKRIKKLNQAITDHNTTISNNTNHISALQQKISVLKEKIKDKKKIDINFFRTKMIEGKTKESLLKNRVEDLKKEIKLSNKCDLCNRPLSKQEAANIRKQRQEQLVETQNKYDEIKVKVAKAKKSLDEKEAIVSAGNKAELDKGKAEIKISKLQSEVDRCLNENDKIAQDIKALESRDFKGEIETLKSKIDKDQQESLQKYIDELEKNLKDIKRKGDRLNVDYGSKIRRRNEITNLQKQQRELQSQIDKLKNDFVVLDKLKGYFGKDGIQAVIIENVISELENYANDTLAKICNEPTSISIKTQKQNDNGSWSETFDILVQAGSRTDDFDTFSGGEKFRISLALRLALSNVLSNRMGGEIKFLLLDEVSSNLDNKGLNMFIDIIKQLSQEFKILVITHSERLKDKFGNIIVVDKGQNGSRAIQ